MEWIKVSEQLPEYDEIVLVTTEITCVDGSKVGYVEEAYLDESNCWRTIEDLEDGYHVAPEISNDKCKVIAWMHYPAPYQGD